MGNIRIFLIFAALILTCVFASCSKASDPAIDLKSGSEAAANKQFSKAVELFKSVIAHGNKSQRSKAEYELGVLFKNGNGVKKSSTEAISHFSKSADGGFAPAHRVLAALFASNASSQTDWSNALLNMGTAEMRGLELSPSLRNSILSHFSSVKVNSVELRIRYGESKGAKISGTARHGDELYKISTNETRWALVYVDQGSSGFMGYVDRSSAPSFSE